MSSLKDKVAIVTGASSGIGAGIVKELLQSGMKVVGLARRKAKVEELGKEKNVGPIYVLVNNAGVAYRSSIDEADIEKFKQVLNTNVLALTICTKEAVKRMKANKVDGFIINISSVAGQYPAPIPAPIPGLSIYTTSKYGVTAFTESIRRELATSGSKIRVTNLSPGLVESEMAAGLIDKYPYIKSEDIAKGVTYIISQPAGVNVAELTLRPAGEAL
ncbi:short chain dehydrogenase [Popillia japonica]|uniref:Short chain dehydrogenase n=1 Tax=Popillia japonica TaxID=7064 RepID=A0AAW1LXR2_POPJA